MRNTSRTSKTFLPCLNRLQEGLRQGLACSFVGIHEEVQHQHQPYPSRHKPLYLLCKDPNTRTHAHGGTHAPTPAHVHTLTRTRAQRIALCPPPPHTHTPVPPLLLGQVHQTDYHSIRTTTLRKSLEHLGQRAKTVIRSHILQVYSKRRTSTFFLF